MPRHRELRCQEVVELVTDYLERALPPAVRARFEQHLRACRHCADYLRQMGAVVGALGRVVAPALDRHRRAELVAAYRRWTAA
jgi:anti-sigma factor RsiW